MPFDAPGAVVEAILGVLDRQRVPEVPVANHVDRELDVHRRFERVTRQFAVALCGVAVANEQERTGMVYGQVDGRALANLVVVHVPAEPARIGRADRPLPLGRHGNAPEHRLQRNREILERLGWFLEQRHVAARVDAPAAVEADVPLQVAERAYGMTTTYKSFLPSRSRCRRSPALATRLPSEESIQDARQKKTIVRRFDR
jgi:hypothetical protein